MSNDLPIIDDLHIKQQRPNHLASPIERLAAAGVSLPDALSERIAYLKQLTVLVQQLLPVVLGEMANSCQVINARGNKLTLGLPSMTATNHVTYMQASCLQVLRQHDCFAHFDELKVVFNAPPQSTKRFSNPSSNDLKKPLSENTKRTITQHASDVISSDKLRHSLIELANHIKVVPDSKE